MRSFYLIDTLYYFAAAASHELNHIEKRNAYLFKCISLLSMEDNQNKIAKYKDLFKERFDIDVRDLTSKHYK